MIFADYTPFIEQLPSGIWIYGKIWHKPWWKFWAKDRKSFHSARTREEAEQGLRKLEGLYTSLGVFQK